MIATPLALAAPASANPAGTGLVISEVYGGGGNSGSSFTNDFVEIFNPTGGAISLGGKSIQYRSAGGTGASNNIFALPSVDLPAGKSYLVSGAAGATPSTALPTPDATSSINLSGTGGQVYLAAVPGAIDPNTPPGAAGSTFSSDVIDFVGWGSSTTSFEGTRAAATTNPSSVSRAANGADTDVNSADFTVTNPPTPQNCDCAPPPPEDFVGSIAEIQGTDATVSPYVDATVVTEGVVTATYPTGGLNGFTIQTEGTGGADDATPGASDGIFVYGPGVDESTLSIGDFVEVTGPVSEFNTVTQITADAAGDVVPVEGPFDPVTPLAAAYPTTEADREAHEGELLAPTDDFTVTNTFNTNSFAEVGLATGNTPLRQPTDVADAQDTAAINAVVADNLARGVILDDGSTTNYLTGSDRNTPLPWLSKANPIRVGAQATLNAPVVLSYGFGSWRFQPQQQVTGDGSAVATFENTRTQNQAPAEVGGNLKLATFNVLNYFNTTGTDFVAAGGSCTYFSDRTGDPVGVNSCNPNGPRGAAEAEDFERQQAKIVTAINLLGADIVSLEEIENSVKLLGETDRDDALSALVDALNAEAGEGTWDYAPSPAAEDLPELAEQDVIRTAFIFKPATVDLVGASKVLVGNADFSNAREPLAQAFKAAGASDEDAFGVIVNHFKSKGSGVNDGTGQGNANPDRIAQAQGLSTFADEFATERGIEAVFLTGDFNSYTMEDPLQELYADGYTKIESDTPGEVTYSFSGLAGSLDHVLANEAAEAMVTGADIWNINSPESVAFQYSRHNYNATDFYEPNQFAASDHDPEVVGLSVEAPTDEVQILGINDFHGRIENNAFGEEAGAAVLAGAVKQLRQENPDTVFSAAGDLIGASTFASFIAKDKPTIDALNEAGLEVSAVGNHEFDQGYDDLLNRVMAPYDADTNKFGGAEWEYIGANVHKPGAPESELLEPTWVRDFGDVQVGFVGAVTEHLDELVSPAGIEGVVIEDIVEATNREADRLKSEGVDIVVLLVHEGAATTAYADAVDPASDFGEIVTGVNDEVDAIISGHTHLAYNHAVPVPGWETEGRAVTTRPVVSAGQYGANLNQLLFSVDPGTGEVTGLEQNILDLKEGNSSPNYPADSATRDIVTAAVAEADVLGAEPLGDIAGPFNRARLASGAENRGGESTIGNLVAEAQRWATDTPEAGSAEIAFMNPGGLRANMVGSGDGAYPRTVTFKQAANVQPFANTLVNMDMTGAQIRSVLEEQWQPAGASRPFLRLGTSEGFTYTYDPTADAGSRITQMRLDGRIVRDSDVHSVTVNSFLAAGGDNFGTFADITGKQDTGKIDLSAMVDFMDEFASDSPLPVDYAQRVVGVRTEPFYIDGENVDFSLSSLAMTGAGDLQDNEVEVSLDGELLGTFPVDNSRGATISDEYGTAEVSVRLPEGTPVGTTVLTVTGPTTGTTVQVPVQVRVRRAASEVSVTATPDVLKVKKGTSSLDVTVTSTGGTPAGFVAAYVDGEFATAAPLSEGSATLEVGPFDTVGEKEITVEYIGDLYTEPSSGSTTVTVQKARPKVKVKHKDKRIEVRKERVRLNVQVLADGITGTGEIVFSKGSTVLGSRTLDDGRASMRLPKFGSKGRKTITVSYSGDDLLEPRTVEEVIRVVRRR
ncbi:ExeM/NucH family extracellular endonuclease [Nocardioides donggukensis]|uniref:ExeM/NucH family extracellular endonuclease n=1 Tax=Nocardioides donggukensis TaxID=2774019 RepID=A0A927K4A5_9ACTN|nr:ExeM/NucH family extracellular endonuclease [Nocardioides donggukensis]MBD8869842.1 ExeM/NucH family extracellular endonuclease [Nocardioides donggukensis]